MVAAEGYAQSPTRQPEEQGIQSLGGAEVEGEYQLDLTLPLQPTDPVVIETPESEQASEAFEREMAVERHLTDAARAEREGRIDQPPKDCAWFHYRSVLQLDPENPAAEAGLQRVQETMIARAGEHAREMDYESAQRTLEDAALVRDDPVAIEEAMQTIRDLRLQHAAELETAAVLAMDAGDFERAERVLIELIALGEMDTAVNQLRRRLEEARVYGGFEPGQAIRDHFLNGAAWTPETVIVTAGSFMMGSSAFEEGRKDHEGPEHRVTFRRGFAIGRTEVTVAQFREFADRSGYRTDAEKLGFSRVYDHRSGRLSQNDDVHWEMDYQGSEAKDDEPVVHISWNDAQAYTRWLAQGTGKPYRLPSEAEFEYALRGGRSGRYWWGEGSPGRPVENLTGQGDASRSQREWATFFENYSDGFWGPAPVASFDANPFGLHDIGGNVGEWVLDCWHDTYLRAPTDGSAWVNPGCKLRVIRGGNWASSPVQSRSAYRVSAKPEYAGARIGFRIARDL
jgi:formylglycine-generating enzyme required for sulfatase activity